MFEDRAEVRSEATIFNRLNLSVFMQLDINKLDQRILDGTIESESLNSDNILVHIVIPGCFHETLPLGTGPVSSSTFLARA